MIKLKITLKTLDEKINYLGKRIDHIEESNRKKGVLLEKLDAKIDLSLEGYSSQKEPIEKINERVSVLEGRG
jgi:hypothetical protein